MYYIYKITNTLNGKVYIGQTVNEKRRWISHKSFAKTPERTGQYIHHTMKKYGNENFTYEVIDFAFTQSQADCVEMGYIIRYDSRNKEYGYNVSYGGDVSWNRGLPKELQPMYGRKQSEYFRQRMLEVHTGRTVIHSPEQRQQVSQTLMGHPVSEETRAKISAKNKGKKRTPEYSIRMSILRSGKKISPETKAKMSVAHRKFSPEQELNIIRDKKSGMTYRELRQKYGCSNPTITSIMNRNK